MTRHASMLDLADCREFRQCLEGHTPRTVHLMLILLTSLIAGVVAWAGLTRANLVVVAKGRVRPVDAPHQVFTSMNPNIEGRVVKVNFQEGDHVDEGQVLLQLDTESIDNEIEKLTSTIQAGREELVKLRELALLLDQQFATAHAKAEAELENARQKVRRAERSRETDIAEIKADLDAARSHLARIEALREHRAATESEWVDAKTDVERKTQQLARAELPVDDGHVEVLRRAVQLVQREYTYRKEELTAKRVTREGEVSAASRQLESYQSQRRQTDITAPISGVVIAGSIHENDLLQPGKAALEIASDRELLFEVTVPSRDVGDLSRGMPVRIKFEAYVYQTHGVLGGIVSYISPDSKPVPAEGGSPVYVV